MLDFLFKALVIFILVVAGLSLLYNTDIFNLRNNQEKKKLSLLSKILNFAAIICLLVGIAFLGGAFLAKVQNISFQVIPLLVTGIICIICSLGIYLINKITGGGI